MGWQQFEFQISQCRGAFHGTEVGAAGSEVVFDRKITPGSCVFWE